MDESVDQETRFMIGYAQIGTLGFIMLVNILVVGWHTYSDMRRKCKVKHHNKMLKEHETKRAKKQ